MPPHRLLFFIGDYMPEFCMQAPNEIPDIVNVKYPCYIQPKLDGYRGIYIPHEGFYSKSGKLFRNNPQLLAYLTELVRIKGYVVEGEFYIHGMKPQHLASYLNTYDAKIDKPLKFFAFDCIPIEDWITQKCTIPYEQRLRMLRVQINGIVCNYSKVIDMSTDIINMSAEASIIYKNYLKFGYEGCIIRNMDAPYYWKRVTVRNGAVLKLKPYETLDLKIVDIYEGEKALEGSLGGIVVDYNGIAVRVGSGFTLDLRQEIFDNKAKYIGLVAEIKYLEITENNSLRDPRFIRIRDDK